MKHILPLILFLASGCAATEWRHNTKNAADFERDKAECMYQGQVATINLTGIMQGYQQAEIAKACMELRGYRRVAR